MKRYEGVGGGQIYGKNALRNTWMAPYTGQHDNEWWKLWWTVINVSFFQRIVDGNAMVAKAVIMLAGYLQGLRSFGCFLFVSGDGVVFIEW